MTLSEHEYEKKLQIIEATAAGYNQA